MKLLNGRNCIFILFILIAGITLGATANSKYEEGKLYKHQLSNGMVVFTVERHIAPLIYHQLTYRVGSCNEHLGITGISHVVEHMMFKGTAKYGKGKASKTISDEGGIFNAFTMNDMTSYYEYLPSNKIEIAFDIESDRMQNCLFDTAEFKSEISVIKQERRMRTESNVNGILHETLNSIAYQSHPYRDPVIGWPGDLDHLTREEAYRYYKTYYTPNNAFLVLVGDFDTEQILKLAEQYYGRIPKGPDVSNVWAVEQTQHVRKSFTLYHNDVTSPRLIMAFHVPTLKDSDGPALLLAGRILGERSRDARLYKRLVEKEQLAQMATAGMPTTKYPGLFRVSVSLRPDSSLERAEAIVLEEIRKMQNELITDRELQKVKNRYLYAQVTDYIKNADIGGRISTYEAYYGIDYLQEVQQRVLSVTKEDIQRVMQKYLNPEQMSVAYAYPKEPKKARQAEPEEEQPEEPAPHMCPLEGENSPPTSFYLLPELESLALDYANHPDDKNLGDVLRPRPIAPLIKNAQLSNGIKVYMIENHLAPTLTIAGLIETGNMPEANKGGKPGISALLADVMNRGTKSMDYTALSERMAFVPFSFFVNGSYRQFSFQGTSLVKDVNEMMHVGYEMLTQPRLDEQDIETLRTRHIIGARSRFKTTRMQAFYYMFNTIFRNHPYSETMSTEESLKSITKDDLQNLHQKYFRPERVIVVIVGDMSTEQMKALLEKHFGQWKNLTTAPKVLAIPSVEPLATRQLRVFQDKDYKQCTINIGFNPFNDADPNDEEAVDLLNRILAGGVLTSRIGVELRDKQGLIYGIKSELWGPNDRIGYWKMNTQTAPKNVEKVISGIFTEIQNLLTGGVTDEELISVKRRALRLLPLYTETPDDIATIVYDMLRKKEPLDSFDRKADRILAVSKDDIMRVAKKYLTLDRCMIVVDGPIEEHSLDATLAKLPQ